MTLVELVRLSVQRSGRSHQAIAKAAGLSQPSLSHFMGDPERGLKTSSAEAILRELDVTFIFAGQKGLISHTGIPDG
jgi:hypothetical protein